MMFCKARQYRPPSVQIMINDMNIEFVETFKYLGYVFTYNNMDGLHIESISRGLCVRANTLIRNFKNCILDVKTLLFKSFCTTFYCLPLIIRSKVSELTRIRVIYNNCVRKMFNIGRRESIFQSCVHLGIPTFEELRRKAIVSIMNRLKLSANNIIKGFIDINYASNTIIYSKWMQLTYA